MGETGDGLNEELAEAAHDLARAYCKRQHVHMHWLAEKLGYNATTFSNYLGDSRPLPASLVARMTLRCGFAVINELCRQCGGVFIPVVTRAEFGTGAKAYKAALHFVQTSGRAATTFFKALEDGKIDEDEHHEVKKWLSKLAEAITLMQQAFDAMPIVKKSEDASDDLA